MGSSSRRQKFLNFQLKEIKIVVRLSFSDFTIRVFYFLYIDLTVKCHNKYILFLILQTRKRGPNASKSFKYWDNILGTGLR